MGISLDGFQKQFSAKLLPTKPTSAGRRWVFYMFHFVLVTNVKKCIDNWFSMRKIDMQIVENPTSAGRRWILDNK